jgi:hypothetical protein
MTLCRGSENRLFKYHENIHTYIHTHTRPARPSRRRQQWRRRQIQLQRPGLWCCVIMSPSSSLCRRHVGPSTLLALRNGQHVDSPAVNRSVRRDVSRSAPARADRIRVPRMPTWVYILPSRAGNRVCASRLPCSPSAGWTRMRAHSPRGKA